MCGTYGSSAVGLEEVLVADGFVGHILFRVGFIAKVRGWCAPEPVGFVTTPAICEGRDMAFGLQVDTEKRIAIGVLRGITAGAAGSGSAAT